MLLIVGLMFVVLVAVRKYLYKKPQFVDDNLKVLTSISLQPKKAIFLVKVFGRVMLVGVSDNAIAPLGEIMDPEALQKINEAGARRRGKGFSEILASLAPAKGTTQR
ncbi:MAG: flagellar biosynthetic protein FliO [Bacteroidetes bacterium]|nr:flagellar biosynthetic protein FliO [Bacteroidota bacterium]